MNPHAEIADKLHNAVVVQAITTKPWDTWLLYQLTNK